MVRRTSKKQQTKKRKELSESEQSESSDDSSSQCGASKKQKNNAANFNDTNEIDTIVKRENGSFLIKLRSKSYWDTVWMNREELNRKSTFKLLWFENNYGIKSNVNLLNPEWTRIDYILDEPKSGQYLVKWRELPISQSTLETRSKILSNTSEIEFEKHVSHFRNRKSFKDINVKELEQVRKESLSLNFNHTQFELMSHQQEALEKLTCCWKKHENCILSDEHGLGKTVQTIAFLSIMMQNHIQGPFLIISPPQRLSYWMSQIEVWASDLVPVTFVGSNHDKQMIKKYLIHDTKTHNFYSNIILTTFDCITLDEDWFKLYHWPIVVVDQAHRIRNSKTKSFSILKRLQYDFLLLVTDRIHVDTVNEYQELMDLASVSPSSILRREKNALILNKPNSDLIIEVPLSSLQQQYLTTILKENSKWLCQVFDEKNPSEENKDHIVKLYYKLFKACQHPYLNIQNYWEEPNRNDQVAYFDSFFQSSSKLIVLEKLLEKFVQYRVAIFTSFPYIVEELLLYKKIKYSYITNNYDRNITDDMITENIILIDHKTKLAKVSIKFTHFDYIIMFDSDWNPNVNNSSQMERLFTIGKSTTVIRLVCCEELEKFQTCLSERENLKGSFNRKLNEVDMAFRSLAKKVPQNVNSNNENNSINNDNSTLKKLELTNSDIENLLEGGRHKLLISNGATTQDDVDRFWHTYFGMQTTIQQLVNTTTTATTTTTTSQTQPFNDTLSIPIINSIMNYDINNLLVEEQQDDSEEFSSECQYMNLALDLSNSVEALVVDVENIKKALEKTVDRKTRRNLVHILHTKESKIEEESIRLRIYSRQMKNSNIRIVSPTNVLVKGFNKNERLIFYKTILRHGLRIGLNKDEKWQQFYSIINPHLRQKSMQEIKEFGTFILDHLSEQVEQHYSHYSDGTPTDSINGIRILQRIGSMFLINSMVEKYSQFPIENSIDMNHVESVLNLNERHSNLFTKMGKPLLLLTDATTTATTTTNTNTTTTTTTSSEWKLIFDLIILKGCNKHGFAMWNQILMDNSFEFASLNSTLRSLFHNSNKMIIDFLNERLLELVECLSVEFAQRKISF